MPPTPLPGPLKRDEPQSSKKPGRPISASAFSFSLDATPGRKARGFAPPFSPLQSTPVKREDHKERVLATHGNGQGDEEPGPFRRRSRITETPDALVPLPTPAVKLETPQSKRLRPLGHFSPLVRDLKSDPNDPFSAVAGGETNLPGRSPGRQALPRALLRLNGHLDDVKITDPQVFGSGKKRKTRGQGGAVDEEGGEDEEDAKGKIGLSSIVEGFAAPVQIEEVKTEDAAEGIGVSPSRGQGRYSKDSGGGSLSSRLTSLLSAQSSALTLFYTALHHMLYPSVAKHTPRRNPQHPKHEPPGPQNTARPPTIQEQIASAPIQLRLIECVNGRTHAAQMWRCRWVKPPDTESRPVEQRCEQDECLVVFRVLPMRCPQLGLDPRLLADRGSGGDKAHLVGIWEPYTTVRVQAFGHADHEGSSIALDTTIDSVNELDGERREGRPGQEHAGETTDEDPQATDMLVIFATRYLIAHESRTS